jgi:hypothetical protein
MACNKKLLAWALVVFMGLTLPFVLSNLQPVRADQGLVRGALVQLNVGDSLVVQTTGPAIQKLFLDGNLSAVKIQKPSQYPADHFEVTSSEPGTYDLQVICNQTSDYSVNLFVRENGTNSIYNSTSYYVSAGSLQLDVTIYFDPAPSAADMQASSTSPWDSFGNWMGSFGHAFPLWIKALYLVFGVQFLTVGGLWIRRETGRKAGAKQPLDAGEKAYLWLDIVYKFLLVAFVAIMAIMGGELILLFVLRFMFLASINLLSLWDIFVVGFAAGAVIIVYILRFILAKAFDLKPFED